jgi:hypothetical protein
MSTKNATFAIFRDKDEIKLAVRSFVKLGFNKSALWIFQSNQNGDQDFNEFQNSQLKNGAMIGAVIGALIFGAFFLFNQHHFPGNQWALALASIILGAIVGAAGGTLVGIGTPVPVAKRYGQYLKSGGILLSVHSDNPKQLHQAQEVLFATGGQDIHLINEEKTWIDANLERIELEDLELNQSLPT